MVVLVETGDFGGVVGLRPSTPPKIPGFNETTTGFKFLLEKTRETVIFGPSFTETVKKTKKKWKISLYYHLK